MTLLASIPSPGSAALHLGPLQLRAYGLMIALGVIAAVWLFGRRLEQAGIGTRDDASTIAIWGVGAGIIGARLYHVVTSWNDDYLNPLNALKIWEGGLGVPGGLFAGIVFGIHRARRLGLPVGPTVTAAVPAIPLAQAIGRWGNWFNQEVFGRPTDLPWALEIDPGKIPDGYAPGTTFHPTFLYESLGNLVLCGVLIVVARRVRLRPGALMGVYLAGYSLLRFGVESLRIDAANEILGLRVNTWISGLVFIGAVVYLVLRGRPDPEPANLDADPEPDVSAVDAVDPEPAEVPDGPVTDP